jgi:polar amino acid transport system substrate-binding protein
MLSQLTATRLLVAAVLACAVALGACGGSKAPQGGGGGTQQASQGGGAKGGKQVTVATSADFAPLSFRSKQDPTKIVGFEIDMLNALTKDLGWQYKLRTSSFDGLIPSVQSGRVNMVVSDVYHIPERDKVVDFVDYLDNSFAVLVRGDDVGQIKSYRDLCGKTMGILTGSAPEADAAKAASKQCTDAGKPAIKTKSFTSVAQELPPLANGTIDAVLEEFTSVSYVQKTSHGKYRVAFPDNKSRTRVGIVLKTHSDLADPLTKALKAYVGSAAYRQNAKKWGVPEKALLKPGDVQKPS